MAASKKLVYLPTINNSTWLLMTKVKQGTCLRDYSTTPKTENRQYSFNELQTLLAQEGSYSETLPAFSKVPYSDEEFWREQIAFRNAESVELSTAVDRRRLLDRFKENCNRALTKRSSSELRAIFESWVGRFHCIKRKEQFNHWDNDSADIVFSSTKGIGWTSQLLEESRRNSKVQFVSTGCQLTDFSLIAMELGFGISSKNNRFRKGSTDFIKPDGLAVRKNGFFTIVEVKGPQDEAGLIDPLLQATCGALALIAKGNMIREIAKKKGKRRPAVSRAEIPKHRRSLGIHILSQAGKNGGPREPWTEEVEAISSTILNAFSQLEYIAYSFVTANEAKDLRSLKTDYLITTSGVTKF